MHHPNAMDMFCTPFKPLQRQFTTHLKHEPAIWEMGLPKVEKKLRFEETVKVSIIPNTDDYSEEEKEASFVTDEDFEATKERCYAVAESVSYNYPLYESTEPLRGLERLTIQGGQWRRWNYCKAVGAVLNEQDALQQDHGRNKDFSEALADVYRMHTKDTATNARFLGITDEQEAWQMRMEAWMEWCSVVTMNSPHSGCHGARRSMSI
jgi:hypothetical protein